MKDIEAVNNKVLDVDLTSRSISEIVVTGEERRLYLGGKGLALKLLYGNIKQGIDPLSPDNILVMMSGLVAALFFFFFKQKTAYEMLM